MQIIQNVILPGIDGCTDERLYFRVNQNALYSYADKTIRLSPDGKVNFNTYFNQLSTNRWGEYCDISQVYLEVETLGRGVLTIELDRYKHSRIVLQQHKLESSEQKIFRFELPSFQSDIRGLLSFKIESQHELEFKAARFLATKDPHRKIALGIVITAFKRNDFVIPAIQRLDRDLLRNEKLGSSIQVAIVDNGNTLTHRDIPASCALIHNRNLGGSGGFARGLYYFQKEAERKITHCLFMDDDASCESEAILRTIALLSYAKGDELAVAGAMMLERLPYLQHESGAVFDMRCIALKNGLNLRSPSHLTENDIIEKVSYGAWWFFAFPVSKVRKYPFPFFVRGDDVLFSMSNNFDIATLNGVASWQESFAWKSSPLTAYLDTRQQCCQYLLNDKLIFSLHKILTMFWYFFLKQNFSYHYFSAHAICIALSDVLEPASFWKENIDMNEKRAQLAPLLAGEKLLAMKTPTAPKTYLQESILLKVIRWASLNGHLIPKVFMKNSTTLQKTDGPFLRKVFCFRKVQVFHFEDGTGYELNHQKGYFFANIVRAIYMTVRLLIHQKRFKKNAKYLEQYMTPEFWEGEFSSDTSNQRH